MLMSRHGVTDGRPQAHSWGEGPRIRWIPSVEHPRGEVLSARTDFMTAFRNVDAFIDDDREVAL